MPIEIKRKKLVSVIEAETGALEELRSWSPLRVFQAANSAIDNWWGISSSKLKLDGIEDNATADLTGSEIKSLYEAESDTNAFTDSEKQSYLIYLAIRLSSLIG